MKPVTGEQRPLNRSGSSDRFIPAARRTPSGFSLAAAAYVFAVVMMGTTLPTPLYPAYGQHYGFGSLTTTVLFAVYALGVIVALVLFGNASIRLGRKPVLVTGVVLSLVSAALFLTADQLWILYLGRVISGLSAGIFTATGTVSVMENAPESRKTLASAMATAANIGGLGLGVLLSGVIAGTMDSPLRAPFLAHAVMLVIAGAALMAVRETVVPDRTAPVVRTPRIPRQARAVFAASSVGTVAGFATCSIYTSIAPGFMAEALGVGDPVITGTVVSLLFGASAVAQISLRSLPDRTLLIAGSVSLTTGMLFLAVSLATASLPLLVASVVLAGAGQGVLFMTGIRAITESCPPVERTPATTSYFIVAYVAISVPPVVAGLVSLTTSLTTTGILSAAVIALVTLVGLVNVRKFSASRR